jgi:hypothetical protein
MRVTIKASGRDGRRYVYLTESYRDDLGRPRQRIVERHGLLDDLLAADPLGLDKLRDRAERLGAGRVSQVALTADLAAPADLTVPVRLGHLVADAVWEVLGVGPRVGIAAAGVVGGELAEGALRAMTLGAIMFPHEPVHGVERLEQLFGLPSLTLAELRQGHEALGRVGERVQAACWQAYQSLWPPAGPVMAFRVRQAVSEAGGDSPRHCLVLADAAHVPMAIQLFEGAGGNPAADLARLAQLRPGLAGSRAVVAGPGADLTPEAIYRLHQMGHGWLAVHSVRSIDQATEAWIASPQGWVANRARTARTKSRLVVRSVGGAGMVRSVLVREKHVAEQVKGRGGVVVVRTSELDLPDGELLERHRALRRVERSLAGLAQGAQTNPGWYGTREQIDGHVAVWAASWTLLAVLTRLAPAGAPSEAMVRAMQEAMAVPVGQGVYRLVRPAAVQELDRALGLDGLDRAWTTGARLHAYRRALPGRLRVALTAATQA